jgi:hypothetical protein
VASRPYRIDLPWDPTTIIASQEDPVIRIRLATGLVALALAAPAPAVAQPRGSERATVTQMVNGTTISIDFGRPVARGRENLFGGVIHWDEVWTPGANWATTLEVDRPVTLNGHRVRPGRDSVWLEPRQQGPAACRKNPFFVL